MHASIHIMAEQGIFFFIPCLCNSRGISDIWQEQHSRSSPPFFPSRLFASAHAFGFWNSHSKYMNKMKCIKSLCKLRWQRERRKLLSPALGAIGCCFFRFVTPPSRIFQVSAAGVTKFMPKVTTSSGSFLPLYHTTFMFLMVLSTPTSWLPALHSWLN